MSTARRVDPIGSQSTITRYFVRHSNENYPGIAYIHTDSQIHESEISSWPTDGSDVVVSPHRSFFPAAGSSGSAVVSEFVQEERSEVSVPTGDELPVGRDFIPVNSEVETNTAHSEQVNWLCRYKKAIRDQIRRFYKTGSCKWKQEIITDEARLAAVFPEQAIMAVLRNLQPHRSYWHRMAQSGVLVPEVKKQERLRHRSLRELSIVSYNILSAYDRLDTVFEKFADADIICIQSTCLPIKKAPLEGKPRQDTTYVRDERTSQCGKFHVISWGHSRGSGSNKSCGVVIALNKKTLPKELITHRYDPFHKYAGRWGAIRISDHKYLDLIVGNVYHFQEDEDEGTKHSFWHMVNTDTASFPKRAVKVIAGDFNGDICPQQQNDPLVGRAYPCTEPTQNGAHLLSYMSPQVTSPTHIPPSTCRCLRRVAWPDILG